MANPLPCLLALAALAWLGGCAPTTISPMIIRMSPGAPGESSGALGLRAGPRLATAISPRFSSRFEGDGDRFGFPQWSFAYDLSLTRPLYERTSLHFGVQGEFYYPFPLPAYGAYAGLSHYFAFGRLGIAPSLCVRGGSDFGISSSIGGPGSQLGLEASATFSVFSEERVSVGVAPFLAVHRVWSGGNVASAAYFGAVVVAKVDQLELTGGFGRVVMPGVASWGVPLLGVRGGD